MTLHLSIPVICDQRDPWLTDEIWLWRTVAVSASLDFLRMSMCHLWNARTSGVSNANDAITATTSLLLLEHRHKNHPVAVIVLLAQA